MRSRVAIVAVVVVIAVTMAACAVPSTRWVGSRTAAPSGSTAPSTINWRDCADKARDMSQAQLPTGLSFDCGTLTVPQDWSTAVDGKAPDGKTLDLALIRVRSDDQQNRIGSLLLNPGGPGASGVEFAVSVVGRLAPLTTRFDLIGFDPRGVGGSNPVRCSTDSDLDTSFGYEPDPKTQASFDGALALTRRIDQACATKYDTTLSLFSTKQAARDMDAIRASVGDDKLNYLGYSYGTLLGAVYAQLFPTRIRAMVLDGAVDPTQQPIASAESMAKGFERAFANFVTWCGNNKPTCPISADPRAAVLGAINSARTDPVAGTGRKATAGWVFLALLASLYSKEAWPYLARGIQELSEDNAETIFMLADSYADRDPDGTYSNLFDANIVINCADSDQYPAVETIRALQGEWRKKYPLFGAPVAVGMLACSLWAGKPDPYPAGPAEGAPPIVVVGTKGDPATPYEQTAKLADMLGVGKVLTWEGEGHTAYPETPCIRDAVNDYLFDLKVPAVGLTCPA